MAMSSSMGVQAEPFFPTDERGPETKRHLKLRTLLYQVLELAFADRAAIGCDQFVYWDPTDPKACLAPDAFVRFGEPDSLFPSWKTWERGGPPDVAVEIISKSDERDRDWGAKIRRYTELGVRELVRFDAETSADYLRVWDLAGGELIERGSIGSSTPSSCLPGHWLVLQTTDLGPVLRLSRDRLGHDLFPTPEEERAKAAARVLELEAELKRRSIRD